MRCALARLASTAPAERCVEALYAIADRQGWLVDETLERALAALQRELARLGAPTRRLVSRRSPSRLLKKSPVSL
jgi:hypothetical protein